MRVLKVRSNLDLSQKALTADDRAEFRAQHLERDRPVVPDVLCQVHGRHPPLPHLAVDPVAVRQRYLQAAEHLGHVGFL